VTAPGPAVGVLRETAAGERRVALTPDGVTRLRKAGSGWIKPCEESRGRHIMPGSPIHNVGGTD
jgi:hypothetical protein